MRTGIAWMAAAGAVATWWLTGAPATRAQIPTLPTTTAPPTTVVRTTSTTSTARTTTTPPAVTTTRVRTSTTATTRQATTTSTLSTIAPVAGTGVTTTSELGPTVASGAGQGNMPAWPVAVFILGVLGTVAILGAEYIRTRPPT